MRSVPGTRSGCEAVVWFAAVSLPRPLVPGPEALQVISPSPRHLDLEHHSRLVVPR
jgi:hypothetical protein